MAEHNNWRNKLYLGVIHAFKQKLLTCFINLLIWEEERVDKFLSLRMISHKGSELINYLNKF